MILQAALVGHFGWALWAAALSAPSIQFTDVTVASQIVYTYDRDGSTTVGDYNGDGWLDVLVTGSDTMGVQLFRNNGDKTFTNVSATVLPAVTFFAHMGLFSDMDNDGDEDLLIGIYYAHNDSALELLINNNGVFEFTSQDLSFTHDFSRVGAIPTADMDDDGDLDVFLMHKTGPNFYLRNDGIEQLVDRTTAFGAGLNSFSTRTMCTVLVELNGDSIPDVFAAVDFDSNYYARSVPGQQHVWDLGASGGIGNFSDMGVAVGDCDNDGDMDLYVTNITLHVLYMNDGTGTLSEEAALRGVDFNGFVGGRGWGTQFGDLDHDMDLDLPFVTTFGPWGSLFENTGDCYFRDVTNGSNMVTKGRGLVMFDYDRDGDLDILKGDLEGNPVLYENTTPGLVGRHWLIVELEGTYSNRAGIGARVQATVGEVTMTREILSAESFLTGCAKYAHFGLAGATSVDRIDVLWPRGATQTLFDVAGDQYISITEQSCQCDTNADKTIDLFDVAKFMAAMGSCTGDASYQATADTDVNGCVDLIDHRVLVERLGLVCP